MQITDLSNDALTQLLLYGDQDLSYDLNKNILELTFVSFAKLVSLTKIIQPSAMHKATTTSLT